MNAHWNHLIRLICLAGLLATAAHAVLDIPNELPKVSAAVWNPILDKTWAGLKKRNIDAYTTGLIHRPKSETPGDAVSEGVGYGMIVALYSNDQATFNKIWDAANKRMWGSCYYNWRVSESGATLGTGAATDAEEDVALMLIFADRLVQAGKWTAYSDGSGKNLGSYATHAQTILDCMWSSGQIVQGKILAPGAGWGGTSFVNPGYFSPAWYRIFADFDATTSHNWQDVIDQSYLTLAGSPAFAQGMIPDWTTPAGTFTSPQGYNPYLGGKAFFKDAIRILWRIALDALWFNEPKAKTFLGNSLAFINSKGGAPASNFYQIEGDSLGKLVPIADKWTEFNDKTNLNTWRWRREHSHLTIGMWATAAAAVGTDTDKKNFSTEMAKYYEKSLDADFFGKRSDPASLEDTLHNEMYFDQFLAWFGTATLTGLFSNIVDDLDHPKTAVTGIEFDPFAITALRPRQGATLPSELKLHFTGNGSLEIHPPVEWNESTIHWTVYGTNGKILLREQGATLQLKTSSHPGLVWIEARSTLGTLRQKAVIP